MATQHSPPPPPPPLLSYVLSLDLQRKIFIYVIIKYLCIHEAAKSILDHTKAYKPIRSFCSLKTYVMLLLLFFFSFAAHMVKRKRKGPPKIELDIAHVPLRIYFLDSGVLQKQLRK